MVGENNLHNSNIRDALRVFWTDDKAMYKHRLPNRQVDNTYFGKNFLTKMHNWQQPFIKNRRKVIRWLFSTKKPPRHWLYETSAHAGKEMNHAAGGHKEMVQNTDAMEINL